MKHTRTVLLAVFAVSIGQILLKYGLNKLGGVSYSLQTLYPTLYSLITSPAIVIGALLFGLSSLLWLLAISEADLSYAYPLLGLGYAVVAVLSWLFFHEALSTLRFIGVFIITAGVILMARS